MAGKKKTNLVDGKYSITDLVDIKRLKRILNDFSKATGFTTLLVSHPDNEILIDTGLRDICMKFHMGYPESEKLCKESNECLTRGLKEQKEFNVNECGNGLVDGATPIIVKGTHIASLITGQIFLKKPDLERFKEQAKTYGYDEKKYLKALNRIPVVSETQLKRVLSFVSEIAVMIADQGLSQIEVEESRGELKKEIAEKEAVFDALKKSEEKFRYFFENSTEAIFTKDLKGSFTSANNFMAEVMGCSIDELVGMSYREFANSEKCNEVYKAYNKLYLTGKQVKDLIHEVTRQDGTKRILSGNINAIRKDGEVVGFQGSMRDITARIEAEAMLQDSEELLKATLESSGDGVLVVDEGGRVLHTNNRFFEMWQIPESLLKTKNDEKLLNKVLDQLEEPEAFLSKVKELYNSSEESFDILKFKDNRVFERYSCPLIREGEKRGRVWSFRDITEQTLVEQDLKKTEERFARIVENAKDMICRMSLPDGNYEYVSPASKEVVGFTPEEMYENPKLIQDSVHPDWVDYFKEQWKNLLNGDIPPVYEFQMIHKSGEERWLNQRNVLIRDDDQNVIAIEGIVTDITIRKRMEEYLVKSEERYRALVESTNDGIVVVQEGKFRYFNDVFAYLLDYTADELRDQSFEKFVHPDDVERVVDMYRKRIAGEDVPRTYGFDAIRKDGSKIPVEISVTLTEWDDKPATLCLMRDITEREKTKRLLVTQRVLASTLNAASDLKYALYISLGMALEVSSMDSGGIYIVNDDKSLDLVVNDGLSKEFVKHISHIDLDSTQAHLILKGDPIYSSHAKIIKKRDSIRKKEGLKAMAILPIQYEGRVISCINVTSHTLEEFTESAKSALETIAAEVGGTISRLMAEKKLRESEERFRNIVEASPMGMFMYQLEPDGRLVLLGSNPSANNILGVDTSKLIGMTIEEAFPLLTKTTLPKMYKRAAKTGESWHTKHIDYEDDRIKEAIEIYAFQTSPNKMVVMFLDVLETVRAEEEIRRYRDNLEELVQERTKQLKGAQEELIRKERLAALGRLTATVSHEIRNPLGTVRTSVFSIGDAINRNEMERVDRALKLAERNIVRCDEIIGDLLDYTRVKELRLIPTNIDEWLGELLDEHSIPKDIKCERKLNSGAEIAIDKDQFRRAIINVVNNAIQAFDEDSDAKKFVVKTGISAGRLEIGVIDTGAGISDEIFEKIFEPLFSNKSFGVGMGLPIVRNIMTQHGGNVEIERMKDEAGGKKGQGTSVLLWLPLIDENG